ncbi:MAG: type II toxin-antitoxin system RelE/ParE family toxin [Nanoarchaeota archaeon]
MKIFKVYQSKLFSDKLKSMPKDFKDWIEKVQDQLVSNPYVGKPLGVDWLREKKYGKYRIYYLIYEDIITVFMVNLSEKKDQQKIINTIKLFLEMYKDELMELSKK